MKVTYTDHMGSDLSVVNAARVSFGKQSDWEWVHTADDGGYMREVLSKSDQNLIGFLARGCTAGEWSSMHCEAQSARELFALMHHVKKMPPHWSPFAHTAITMHLKMPIFVARQIMKHTTGIVFNEVSRRYVDSEPEFFLPTWRGKAGDAKQGSGDILDDEQQERSAHDYTRVCDGALNAYMNALDEGVCPEQARMVLPQSMYTEVIMTGNLYAIANLYNQRTDSHAQKETQEIAKMIGEVVEGLYPVSWRELTQ